MGLKFLKPSPYILEKTDRLCRLLWQRKREYERMAVHIQDKELQRTILTLAQENNQYACELSSQVQTLGGSPRSENDQNFDIQKETETGQDENEILAFCKMNEKEIVNAYREILNESFLHEGLRKMIRYQLNGILCAFMQLKLLSSLKFNPANFEHTI